MLRPTVAIFLLFVFASTASAEDKLDAIISRLDALMQRVEAIEQRLDRLERIEGIIGINPRTIDSRNPGAESKRGYLRFPVEVERAMLTDPDTLRLRFEKRIQASPLRVAPNADVQPKD